MKRSNKTPNNSPAESERDPMLTNEQAYYSRRRDGDFLWTDYVRDRDDSRKRSDMGSWSVFTDESKKSPRHR